ncbi:Uncharacterised protein [Vibrio cholerae]|nr:Uncharacterised protein [Vibrio cholerae]CSI10182.1 Uncharacterised protein [Vibrio cholerae]CSI38747.1 Uncharacterised protein [Vibrio cholerae]
MNQFFKILVSGCDDSHIDFYRDMTANAIKLTIRQHAQ